jgi:DNA-binding transcriptional ArsR family regulator
MKAASRATQNTLVALAHPTRRRILREMNGGPPASPRELAERIDDSLSNVSYHFRVLAVSGILKLVSTKQVRGSTQHFYGMSIEEDWAQAVLALDERDDGGRGEELAKDSP